MLRWKTISQVKSAACRTERKVAWLQWLFGQYLGGPPLVNQWQERQVWPLHCYKLSTLEALVVAELCSYLHLLAARGHTLHLVAEVLSSMINESGLISDAAAARWYVLCQNSFKFSPSTDLLSFISWAALEAGLFSPHKQVHCSFQENLFHFKIFLIFRTQLFLHKHRLYSLLLAT